MQADSANSFVMGIGWDLDSDAAELMQQLGISNADVRRAAPPFRLLPSAVD